jgi:hypothetical protein
VDLKWGAATLPLRWELAVSVDEDPDLLPWLHLFLPADLCGDRLPKHFLACVVDRVALELFYLIEARSIFPRSIFRTASESNEAKATQPGKKGPARQA